MLDDSCSSISFQGCSPFRFINLSSLSASLVLHRLFSFVTVPRFRSLHHRCHCFIFSPFTYRPIPPSRGFRLIAPLPPSLFSQSNRCDSLLENINLYCSRTWQNKIRVSLTDSSLPRNPCNFVISIETSTMERDGIICLRFKHPSFTRQL